MASVGPFPGMDPWLERQWSGVHHLLISMSQAQLNRQLRPLGLVARIEERVYVESAASNGGRRWPDVHVIRSPMPGRPPRRAAGGTAVLDEPVRFQLADEAPTISHIEIVDAAAQSVVITAVEVISPTNKIDPRARREYLAKRETYREAGVNTVEIDLLREGDPLAEVPLDQIPPDLRTPYAVWVRRGRPVGLPEAEYYPIPLRSPLPKVGVPLRDGDDDAALDLQAALDAAYEQGTYDLVVDYDRPPDPPLSPDDAAWAAGRVAAWRAANAAG